MKELTLAQAKEIANLDISVGIAIAIDELEKYGFDCNYYWSTMANYSALCTWRDEGYDELNIKTRDELYDRLGIRDLMTKAYTEVVYDKRR